MKKIIMAVLILSLLGCGVVGVLLLNNKMDTLNYATWDMLPDDTKGFFSEFYNGDMIKGETFYKSYFMKYNPVHEVGHAVRSEYGIKTELYEEEQSVNDIAVAYWREIGEGEFIENLKGELEEALANMENPVPDGEDPEEYFNNNYNKLGKDPAKYGYFQFSFVLKSIEKEETLYEALRDKVTNELGEKSGELTFKSTDAQNADPKIVVQNFVEYLKLYNVESPEIKFNKKYRATIQSID